MENYSIMPLFEEHIEEIISDSIEQYKNGVSTCPLFMVKLVPEGDPPIDKARISGALYEKVGARLREVGVQSGILVQCTIGHGYPLDEPNAFQDYVSLNGAPMGGVVCPYDKGFQQYLTGQFKTLASYKPSVIMVDDDFRLLARPGQGCACPLHMAATEKRIGRKISREELFSILRDESDERCAEYKAAYVDTVRESLIESASAMRRGIDAVDPTIKGVFCLCGNTTEFAADIAEVLAGEGHEPTVRVNNGHYTPDSPRTIARRVSYRAAQQKQFLGEKVKTVLAETDTCPQNRYSTGAYSLHNHFTLSILEGLSGAKHWITRLGAYEPESGIAYRRVLSENRGFYEVLSALVPTLRFEGCRIPLFTKPRYTFSEVNDLDYWASNVLERYGVPTYCSAKDGGAAFLCDDRADGFSDEEITRMLSGTVFLSGVAAKRLEARGFSHLTGVKVADWKGEPISGELIEMGIDRTVGTPTGALCLIPKEGAERCSTVYHLKGGKERVPLFPGTVYFENELGGKVITFSGTPNTPFHYSHFSFLNQSRKAQILALLERCGNLPIYYDGDEEVYLKFARGEDGSRYAVLINIGLDPIKEIKFGYAEGIGRIETLEPDGSYAQVDFSADNGIVRVKRPAFTSDPVVLKFSEK